MGIEDILTIFIGSSSLTGEVASRDKLAGSQPGTDGSPTSGNPQQQRRFSSGTTRHHRTAFRKA
jgi:hypothetical protein